MCQELNFCFGSTACVAHDLARLQVGYKPVLRERVVQQTAARLRVGERFGGAVTCKSSSCDQ
jgi:hypothetical protein